MIMNGEINDTQISAFVSLFKNQVKAPCNWCLGNYEVKNDWHKSKVKSIDTCGTR